ncbi:hypothetical protein PG994_004864 [Apiospora phragmitis]|uniref:Uncharacterized protein n=1 Tax=Apiospora phragmitis TaxID=2905665 RepID=A0ABR1VRT0_9PEZI
MSSRKRSFDEAFTLEQSPKLGHDEFPNETAKLANRFMDNLEEERKAKEQAISKGREQKKFNANQTKRIATLEEQLKNMEQKNAAGEMLIDASKQQISTLKELNSTLKKQNNTLDDHNSELMKHIDTLEKQVSTLEEELEYYEGEEEYFEEDDSTPNKPIAKNSFTCTRSGPPPLHRGRSS